jgi:uracil-DNA glycosylase family 4
MPADPRLQGVIEDLTSYLEYQQEEGIIDVEVPRDVIDRLTQAPSAGGTAAAAPTPQPEAPQSPPPVPLEKPTVLATLQTIADEAAACTRCSLHTTRTQAVPGQGAAQPEIMFIGEAPGADEDAQGLAFVGKAGQLLTKMIEAMGYARDEVFIGNILKCRPPGNRAPLPEEMDTCLPFLKQQIGVLKPKVIVALGATATKGLLNVTTRISELRGQWHTFEGTPLMPTFHPAYLLRDASKKREVWVDLQEVLRHLGRTPPARKG